MKFSNEQAEQLGLRVEGKGGTALVHPVHGFGGRRIYIDGGCRELGVPGPLIHLSGFHPAEVEALGGYPNPKDQYSARVTGFLTVTPDNLASAAKMLLDADSPAHEPARRQVARGMTLDALFAQAAKSK
jgi:hypothetical protein